MDAGKVKKNGSTDTSDGTQSLVLVVLDGLGDLPHPDLRGMTPLEAAATPNMDGLAAQGEIGMIYPVRKGVAPESDAGVLGLLGYDPEKESPGRGVLEALGSGLTLKAGDVALRFNFATADSSGVVIDQRVGRGLTTPEAQKLAQSLTEDDLLKDLDISAHIVATVGHRGVVHLRPRRGEPLSPLVTNSDPFYERVGNAGHAVKPQVPVVKRILPLEQSNSSELTAKALNLLSDRVVPRLEGHEVNAARKERGVLLANRLLMRDAGNRPDGMATFKARHGIAGAAVTEMPVERGIARVLELKDIYVGPLGRDIEPGLRERARLVREALREIPFVYVHLKGPDEPGHDGNARKKMEVIAALDKHFMGPFLEGLDLGKVRVAVTGDHSTPCIKKGHSDDPVPLLLAGGITAKSHLTPTKFSEASCLKGTLGEIPGRDLVPLLQKGTGSGR